MNIKKKCFYENENKSFINSKKNKKQISANLLESILDNKTHISKNSDNHINKLSEKFLKNNQIAQNSITLNQANNNSNNLNKIAIDDSKNKTNNQINENKLNDNDNVSFEVKVLFKRRVKKDFGNYLKKNKTKEIGEILKDNNINNVNNNKIKMPQDSIKKNITKTPLTKNTFNNKRNENIDTGKIIFNSIVKKDVLKRKIIKNNLTIPSVTDVIFENIFLLKTLKRDKKDNSKSTYDSISYINSKEEKINNDKELHIYYLKEEKNKVKETGCYSTFDDYEKVIKNNIQDKLKLSQKLLQLKQRNWYDELKLASEELKERKDKIEKDESLYLYIQKIIRIYEHFYWIINSISIFFNILFQNNKKYNPNFLENINLPEVNSSSWNQGFEWKGLYIISIPENKSLNIKNEIKALKYCFYDYLQILEKKNDEKDKILSNEIIFPLIGYSIVNGIVIYVSVLINPDKGFNNDINFMDYYIDEVFFHNKGVINYYSNYNFINNNNKYEINPTLEEKNKAKLQRNKIYQLIGHIEKTYYIENLLESELFMKMSEFQLIPYSGGKFILINAFKFVPNLFEIKYKNYKQINVFSELNHNKLYDTFVYNLKTKTYFNSSKNQDYKTHKEFLDIYKISLHEQLKIKDIIINKVRFRILYTNINNINNKNYKNRRFVDNIINYEKDYFDDENQNFECIGEQYIIIYDLIEPLKLEYSLIKKSIDKIQQNKNRIPFFLQSNYIQYFLSWCNLLNKNSYNIKTYSDLKYSMKKFGINSNLKLFSLIHIRNEEIADIIKISILTKFIKYIYSQHNTNIEYNDKTKYLFEDEKIWKIFFLIKCILYLNELPSNEKTKLENIYEGLFFYTNIFFFKMRLIDDYLSLGLFKEKNIDELNRILLKDIHTIKDELGEFDTTKIFLKNIIYTARKKPFLFLSELELKLNFIINPFIKFKSSISIESMHKKLKLDHINLNNYFNIYSYINSDEISGFILAKLSKDINNNEIEMEDENLIFSDEDSTVYYEEDNNKKIEKSNVKENFKLEEIEAFETKSYNKNLNEKNSISNNHHSRKSSIPETSNKKYKFLQKRSSKIEWNKINENILLGLPSICYKMNFEYEKSINKDLIFQDNYNIFEMKMFFEHYYKIDFIFKNIYSCNGKVERTLFHSLIFMYIISFFVEKNHDECKNIIIKIKEIYSSGSYFLSFADLALINLFQGLSCEGYLGSEEFYSKSVMLLLMLFGDPRGRNNDSHPLMQLPLWKIVRKTLKLEKEQPGNNRYLYEMYKSLEYFNSPKYKLNKKLNNNQIFDYGKNIFMNIKMILKLNEVNLNENEEQNNDVIDLNNIINKEFFLSQNIFNDEMINLYLIKNFNFPFVEEETNNVIKKIYSEEFIIYFFKQIQSILIGNYQIFDENYMNEYISEDIFTLIKNDNKRITLRESNRKGFNKSSINIKTEFQKNEVEFSPSQLINAFQQGKKIFEIFSFNTKPMKNSSKNKLLNNSPSKEIISQLKNGKNPEFISNKNKPGKAGIFSHFLYDELLQKLSYKRNAPSGIVITFGNNTHYETTYEEYILIKYPLLIYKLKNINVKKIFSGWEHNIIISNTNEIYSFGNNNNFQCGIPFSENYKKENIKIKNPQNISTLNGDIKGITAACGNEHTLILDKSYNVYSFGNNEDGVLGIENNDIKSYSFMKVNFGKYNGRIKNISAGTVHNIALTDDGKIFSWGSAQGGQLGLSEKYLTQLNLINFSISNPTFVSVKQEKDIQDSMRIIKISCGEAHTIVLNSKKEVYSWGFGSNGQLGLGFCEDSFEVGTGLSKSRIFTPKKIKTFENIKISDIQCGKTFSMFIDSNGGLYSCGINDLYQLGIPDSPPQDHIKNLDSQCKDFVIPTRVEYFLDMKVEKIACGEAHCIAIVKDIHSNQKLVWSWGNNRYGQLGLGDKNKISLPKPITYLFEYKGNKFESVSCGGFHSLCLITYNEDINWIENDFKDNICKIINEMWNF